MSLQLLQVLALLCASTPKNYLPNKDAQLCNVHTIKCLVKKEANWNSSKAFPEVDAAILCYLEYVE